MSEKVRLEHGFIWTCPNCTCDNHEFAVPAELNAYEQIEIRGYFGVDHAQTGDFVTCPTRVRCVSCGATFDAEPPVADNEQTEQS